MTSQRERILRDLLGIYLRYDQDEIAAALEFLNSGEAFHQFAQLVGESSKLPRNGLKGSPNRKSLARKHVSGRGRNSLAQFISTLAASENKQHQEIAMTLKAAYDRQILSTTSMVQKLFVTIGLPIPERKERLSLIHILAEHLLKLQPDEVTRILRLARDTGQKESSLQRWTDIIVQKSGPDRR